MGENTNKKQQGWQDLPLFSKQKEMIADQLDMQAVAVSHSLAAPEQVLVVLWRPHRLPFAIVAEQNTPRN